jgi:hypothetical protein
MAGPTPQQPLLDELQAWKHNRAVYPGWLIAPEAVRERIWRQTRGWVRHFLRLRPSFSVEQELEILSELNWRLETALVPLGFGLVELGPAYSHVLEAVNPFPNDITDLPAGTLTLAESTARGRDWSAIRRQWLAVAFGLLRHHREERRTEAFAALRARIGTIRDLDGDARARWCYEHCLLALESLNDEAALQALGEWPDNTEDPFWPIRKAAVLAEVGRTDQALEVAERGLVAIRTGLADGPEHIPGLSREGWAMWLVLGLRNNHRWRGWPPDDAASRAEARRRFLQLKSHGCSPDELTDYFASRLEQPAPRPTQEAERTPGFDPGTYSETLQVGDDFGTRLLPAYQYCRLVEEAAQPPSFGHIAISKENVTRVAEWLMEQDAVRSQSLTLRLHADRLLDRYFSRHRVAALRPEAVTLFKGVARRGIEYALPGAPRAFPAESDQALRASHRLECALELLSRMSIREPESGLDELWELAGRLYKEPVARRGIVLGSHLRDLFTNLSKASPRARLTERLPLLFRLPIGGEAEFPVAHPESWPDPAAIAARCFSGQAWDRPPRGWGDLKSRLFALARGEGAVPRRTAFFRLMHLGNLGGLTHAERVRLAGIFWAGAGEPPSLPADVWGPAAPALALMLPDPRGTDALERVRQHILASEPGEAHRGVVWPERYFDLVLDATERLGGPEESPPHRRYIPWSAADATRLLETVRTWWDSRGRVMAAETGARDWRRACNGTTLRQVLLRLWDVVRLVIIPRMARRRAAITAITDLVEEVRAASLPVGAVLPALLALRTHGVQEVASGLRRELANPEPGFFLSALRGIVYWVNYSVGGRGGRARTVAVIPGDLLREVSTAVAVRRTDALELSLDCSYNVIRRLPGRADRLFVRNLLIGLDYLIAETAYREKAAADDRYPYEELPRIRWLAARLATCLSCLGYDREPVIRRWMEAAAADPLPEIRHLITEPNIPVEN